MKYSTVAIGRTMTQRKNHFWSCSGNGIYHAAEYLDIVALSGQWPLSPVCARLVHALETYLLSFCARKGCVSQCSVCLMILMLSGAFHRFGIASCPNHVPLLCWLPAQALAWGQQAAHAGHRNQSWVLNSPQTKLSRLLECLCNLNISI